MMATHHNPNRQQETPDAPFALLMARVRSHLAEAGLDRRSREEIEYNLNRFAEKDADEAFVSLLMQARGMRDTIATLLAYLGELDELGPEEGDVSAFAEAADLFEDISQAAEVGAATMRNAVACHPSFSRFGPAARK
jgi:hypothetical protein